ncbi:MAG: HAD-IC family P-type ATPase [Lachnospiraceae bacterium]|nr:HAD-IC family P-type ATPase [Lachnospiraceae bacterium]
MQGLTKAEVEERINKGLVNTDVQIKTKTIGQIISGHTFTMFNFVIAILAICVAMVNSFKNMTFAGVAVWNLILGVFQEIKAKRIIDKLSLLTNPKSVVIRDGKEQNVALGEIVLDDIILLQNGNQIPADCIVCEGECQVNEGLITGESEPVLKKQGDELLS